VLLIVALLGSAWAGWAGRLRAFVEGDTPDQLTPVGGGAAVSFVHDKRERDASATEGGLVAEAVLTVFTASRLSLGSIYTWDGKRWQVATVELDRAAGSDWPIKHELVQHAD